ncbi:MAG: superoxide dismutase [Hyphomicrobiales bacterium]
MNRRESLTLMAGATAAATISSLAIRGQALAQAPAAPAGPFKLPELGYAYEALEPNIDAMTMTIHHQRHHGAFITNLNQLVGRWPELATMTPEAIVSDLSKVPEAVRGPVRNNVGGHWNHTFFWDLMTPGGAKEPPAALKTAIATAFNSPEAMMEKLNAAGLGRFGSGWAWLVVTKDKKLDVVSTPYQDTPHMDLGARPVIGVDVWEHAYYLKYQNRRGDYLKAWWNTVNWTKAAAHFTKAMA